MTPVRTVARALLAAVFIRSGVSALTNPDRLVPTAKPFADKWGPTLDSVGLPTDARSLVKLNGAVEAVGGILLATNTLTRPAAIALAGSLVPTTLAGHGFWEQEDPQQRSAHQTQFLKNLSLLGGLLLAAVDTQGKPGLAWRAGHLADHAENAVKRAATTAVRETRYVGNTTAREARMGAALAAREARHAAKDAKRRAQHVRREAKIAIRSAKAGALVGR
jgi:putative oxidoreductase